MEQKIDNHTAHTTEYEHAPLPIKGSESKYSHYVTPEDLWDYISPVTRSECGKLHWVTNALV